MREGRGGRRQLEPTPRALYRVFEPSTGRGEGRVDGSNITQLTDKELADHRGICTTALHPNEGVSLPYQASIVAVGAHAGISRRR